MVAVGEPGQVADLDEEPGGAGGVDAVQAQQRGAARRHEGPELLVGGLLARVDPLQVGHELGRDTLAGLADLIARADPSQQCFGLRGRQVLLRTAGQYFQQDSVQLADRQPGRTRARAASVASRRHRGSPSRRPGRPSARSRRTRALRSRTRDRNRGSGPGQPYAASPSAGTPQPAACRPPRQAPWSASAHPNPAAIAVDCVMGLGGMRSRAT